VLFVCVARFAPQKNHALLLKSFAHGPASDPRAHLVLVGEGELRANLEEQAKKLNVAEKVHFLGCAATFLMFGSDGCVCSEFRL